MAPEARRKLVQNKLRSCVLIQSFLCVHIQNFIQAHMHTLLSLTPVLALSRVHLLQPYTCPFTPVKRIKVRFGTQTHTRTFISLSFSPSLPLKHTLKPYELPGVQGEQEKRVWEVVDRALTNLDSARVAEEQQIEICAARRALVLASRRLVDPHRATKCHSPACVCVGVRLRPCLFCVRRLACVSTQKGLKEHFT
jgi:hypothetical protein